MSKFVIKNPEQTIVAELYTTREGLLNLKINGDLVLYMMDCGGFVLMSDVFKKGFHRLDSLAGDGFAFTLDKRILNKKSLSFDEIDEE